MDNRITPPTPDAIERVRAILTSAIADAKALGLTLIADVEHSHPKDGQVCLGGALFATRVPHPKGGGGAAFWGALAQATGIGWWSTMEIVCGFQHFDFVDPTSPWFQLGESFRPLA